MEGLIFLNVLIVSVSTGVHCWVCPVNTRIFTEVGQSPVLSFTTNGLHTDGVADDVNIFQVVLRTLTIFHVNYESGVVLGTPTQNGCFLASSADLANGVLDIELDTVQTNEWGTYRLAHTRRTSTVIQCVTLYFLGTPTTPTITPSGTLYEGTSLSLTCSSISTTNPSNHSLAMMYNWKRDGSKVTANNKFSFDSHLQKTLTISSLSRTDDSNRVMECTATEDGGKTSLSTSYTISVQYGPENIRLNPFGDSKTYNDGDAFTPVSCLADCQPNCNFSWSKGGTLLSSTAVLSLGVVNSVNRGTYMCTATHSQPAHTMTKTLTVSVIYGPDSVSLSPSTTSYTVTEGNNLGAIMCSSTCNPACSYAWYSSEMKISATDTLDLRQVERGEAGSYVCTARNPGSTVSRSGSEVNVSVRYGPDDVTFDVPNVHTVTEGDYVDNIDCSADCWPGCVFTWFNQTNNQPISTTEVLTFGTVYRYDAGNYKCLARNSATQYPREADDILSLRVQYAPDVFISKSTILWTENTPLDLRCKASGVPAIYNFTGFVQRVGDVVVPNSYIESPGVKDSISVKIPSLKLQDAGIYSCYVHNEITGINKHLIQTHSQRIDVQASPQILLKETHFAGETSGNITIAIPFYSFPKFTTYRVFRQDGQAVSTNGKYTLHMMDEFVDALFYGQQVTLTGNVLQITISEMSEKDFGIYKIQIINDVNTANFSFDICAASKPPSPPTELNLTTLDNKVTFEWRKGYNGGYEQTFVLQTSFNSDDSWANKTVISESESQYMKENGMFQVQLTSLVPGIYYARLVTFNLIGAADPVEFKEQFEIIELNSTESSARDSDGPVIGGIFGGIVTALVVVITIVVFLRRKYTCSIKFAKREDLYQDNLSEHGTETEGADHPRYNEAKTYEAVSMTTNTSVYADLNDGNNCPDNSHVYMPLDKSSLKSYANYENVKKEDPVYNNTVLKNPVQTVL